MNTAVVSMPAAAFVVAHGQPMPRLEWMQSDRYRFIFPDPSGEVARLIADYFNRQPAVACEFYSALQAIRFTVNDARTKRNGGAR